MQVKKQKIEPSLEQLAGSKLGNEYVNAVYCQCCILFNLHTEYIIRNASLDE